MTRDTRRLLGARILSEANDLKRTIAALAEELGIDKDKLERIIKGHCSLEETYDVIERMGEHYPIDASDLYVPEDDCTNDVKIMRAETSQASERIFNRKDRNGDQTSYYAYRDTAMSSIGPFKPEWIKELRVVGNADPENPDVAYNNGHFLHQMTFFVGPVNFCWKVDGKSFCHEMNTGDSNYITPFWPHSFANRDKNQEAIIIAVTFAGEVRRSLKELYALGESGIKGYQIDIRNHAKASTQLLIQHLANECVTPELFAKRLAASSPSTCAAHLLDESKEKTLEELAAAARCLDIELGDLLLPPYKPEEEVVVRHAKPEDSYLYPSTDIAHYLITPLARSSRMPLMKGFAIDVLANRDAQPFSTSLHEYVFNYGNVPATVHWKSNDAWFQETIHPNDSMYIKPFIAHAFTTASTPPAKLCVMRVSGAVNLATQKELSSFHDLNRIIESTCWFS